MEEVEEKKIKGCCPNLPCMTFIIVCMISFATLIFGMALLLKYGFKDTTIVTFATNLISLKYEKMM